MVCTVGVPGVVYAKTDSGNKKKRYTDTRIDFIYK
jgi:hypothetical protein